MPAYRASNSIVFCASSCCTSISAVAHAGFSVLTQPLLPMLAYKGTSAQVVAHDPSTSIGIQEDCNLCTNVLQA